MENASYLQFNGSDFVNFISFVKSMGSKEKGSRSILMYVEGDILVCKAIDDTNMIEYHVSKYKSDNEITEPISASISDLATLIKSADNEKFTIRKVFNQYEFNIIGNGWMPFKTMDADASKYKIDGIESDIGTINSVKLRNAISSVLGYTQDYTYVRDMYIQFSKSQMVVTSRLSKVITSDEFVEMTLHRDDATMLKTLLKDNFDLVVTHVSGSVGRIKFTGPKFRFYIIESGIETSNASYINGIKDYITVNNDELYRLAMISEEYSASKHVVGLSIKNKQLNVSIKNILTGKHVSTVTSVPVGNVNDTKEEAEMPSHNLLKTLKLFQDKRSREINIYISDDMKNSIIIFDNNTQAIININNR
jgi:hypothetical protein